MTRRDWIIGAVLLVLLVAAALIAGDDPMNVEDMR